MNREQAKAIVETVAKIDKDIDRIRNHIGLERARFENEEQRLIDLEAQKQALIENLATEPVLKDEIDKDSKR